MIDWKRWLPGMPDDEEEDPVSKTLRTLQQGASDVGTSIGQGISEAGSAISSGISSATQAVQDAYAAPTEQRPPQYSGPSYAQPSLAPGEQSTAERLPGMAQAGVEGAGAMLGDRGAMLAGLKPPQSAMDVIEQAAPAPVRGLQIGREALRAAGGAALEAAPQTTEPLFTTNEIQTPLGTIPSMTGPTPQQAGRFVGEELADPTNYLSFGAVGKAADAPVGAALSAVGRAVRSAPGAVRRGASDAAGAFGDALAPATRAAEEAPGVQYLGSGVVPDAGAGDRSSTLGPVGQRVMDTYTALTPKRVEAVTARGNQVAADAIARRTRPGAMPTAPAELVEQVHAAVVRNLDDTKVVMTGLNPGALRAFLRGEGLTSKAETGDLGLINQITQGQVNVAGGRLKLVDGKRVKVPYSLEDAADFAQRESEQMRGVTGGTRFPDPETGAIDTEAPKVLYAYVSEGQPLVAPNRPTLGLVWKPETPRVSSVNHPFGLLSRAQDIHVGMAEGNKALVYSPEAIRGARHAPAVMEGGRLVEAAPEVRGSGELAFGWEQAGIDVGGGRKLVDSDYLVGPEGESSLRATALVSGMSQDIQQAIARGQMTDPEQIAAVVMRGGSPQWKPGWGSVLNPTRTESLVLDPHLANVQAIYISGTPKNLASMLEGSKTGGVGGGKGERLAELEMARRMRAQIKAETGNDVPIIFNDTTRTAASTAQLEAGASNAGWAPRLISDAQVLEGPPLTLSPGRGRVVDQYTKAIDPTTGEPYMNIGGGVLPTLRAPAYNFAQGGVMGAASESLQAQQEGRDVDPATMAQRALFGGGLATLAGSRAARGAVRRLGSGLVDDAERALGPGRALTTPTRELAFQGRTLAVEATGDPARPFTLQGARGGALTLVPTGAPEGRRYYVQTPDGKTQAGFVGQLSDGSLLWLPNSGPQAPAANRIWRADQAAQRAQAADPAATRSLGSGFVPEEDQPRYRPELSREPVLPGMEPPRRVPGDAGPSISDVPNAPGNRLGNVPPSQIRRPGLPGFESPRPGPVPEDLVPGAVTTTHTPSGVAPAAAQPIEASLPEIIAQLNAPPAAAAREGASLPLTASSPGRARRALNTAARLLSGGLNKVQTARIAGMLSDTAGQLANVAGGPVLQAIDITTGPIAAALDVGRVAATKAVGKPAAREVFFSETGERLKGMARGGSIGIGRAVDVIRGGLDAGEAAKLEQRGGFGTNIRGLAPKGSRAAKLVDAAVEWPLRSLGAADAVFKSSAQGGHLMAEAYAAARKANGGRSPSPEQIGAAARRPEVLERVQYLSSRSVLQEDRMLTNWYKRAMNYHSDDPVEQAVADGLKAGLAVEIPFVRTPYNVVAQGMGMTPAGLLGVLQDVKQGNSAREVEQRLARVMLGTAIMAPVAAGVAEGRFTGPYPETEKERSLLPPGWRPWSAKVDAPDGDTYYLPLSYAQGLAMPIVMGLLAREAYKKDGWSLEAAGKVAAGVGEYAVQETFLEGFGAIGKLFDGKASPATWQREAEQIAASYVPFSGLGREMQRVMGMPARDPEGPYEAMLATNPLTAGQVEPRQDVLGREASLGAGGPAGAVVRAGVENDTGVLRAFRRAGEGLPMQAPDSIPDPSTGAPRPLSEYQQHRWRRVFGAELRQGWVNAGNPDDPERLRAVEARAREAANQTLLGRR